MYLRFISQGQDKRGMYYFILSSLFHVVFSGTTVYILNPGLADTLVVSNTDNLLLSQEQAETSLGLYRPPNLFTLLIFMEIRRMGIEGRTSLMVKFVA